jgi:hypothetical protein
MNEREDEIKTAPEGELQAREAYEPPAIDRFAPLTNVAFQSGVEPVSGNTLGG